MTFTLRASYMSEKKAHAFTLIELLVVIAIIALLLSIVAPSLGKAREFAKRAVCRTNVRSLILGFLIYGQNNNGQLPLNTRGGWYWDLSYLTTDYLIEQAGADRRTFYCPAHKSKLTDDDRFWRFSEWTGTPANPPSTPEPSNPNLRKDLYRTASYFFLVDMEPPSLRGFYPQRDMTGQSIKLARKMTDIRNTGAHEFITDGTISDSSTRTAKYTELIGGAWTKYGLTSDSCHTDRRNMPAGSNVGFADGHADWRVFEDMHVWGAAGDIYHWW